MQHLRQVKASAGSGKTYELTRCFLQRLVSCGAPGRAASPACALGSGGPCGWGDILAVTFTNAAATEMRERVIRQLKSAALGCPMQGIALDSVAAGRWVDAIMRDMSALNIRTIDSLLHLIVRAAALELKLHPDFQPVFATEEALTPYLDLLMEKAWQGDEAMRDLLRQVCRAMVWYGGSKGFLAGEKLLHQLRPLLNSALLGDFGELSSYDELDERLTALNKTAHETAVHLLQLAASRELPWQANALKAVTAWSNGERKTSAYLCKDEAAQVFKKGAKIDNEVEHAYAAFSQAAQAYTTDGLILRQALRLEPSIRMARILAAAFSHNQEQEGTLPGLLVPYMARQVLESDHGVPDTLCRLGSRLSHFLVDEFQDTSQEQWRALRPLVEEALAHGGSLTWVGDVKQSIYGWRDGDPELFDGILDDRGLTAIAATTSRDSLPFNWRSSRQVVEHNNALFSPLEQPETARAVMSALLPNEMPLDLREEIMTSSVNALVSAFAGTRQQCPEHTPDSGFVQIEDISADSAELLNDAVFTRLSDILHEDIAPHRPWADVLVLVRSNNGAALLADHLVRQGIPVITENSLLLSAHPLVIQTVAFLAFLDSPDDNIAFLTLITGNIFHDHADAADLAHTNLDGWCALQKKGFLYQNFRQRWPHVWQTLLAPFFSQSGLMTPYDTVLEWYARLQVEQRFPEATTFLRRFMEVLHSAEEKGLATLSTFLEHWSEKSNEEKVPMPENMDAVRIMTVHKSKGLEAPVVFVPFTGLSLSVSDKPVRDERQGLSMMVRNQKALGRPYYEDLARQARESLNLLYVAFTRARDALYVFRTSAKRQSPVLAGLDILWERTGWQPPYTLGSLASAPEAIEPAGLAAQASVVRAPEKNMAVQSDAAKGTAQAKMEPVIISMPASNLDHTIPEDWRPMQWLPRLKIFRNPLAAFSFRPEDRGNLLHFCLEHLRLTGNPQEDVQAALHFGLRHYPLPVPDDADLRQGVTEALHWLATQPQTTRWLEKGWPEHSIMTEDGQLLRMDLLVRESWGLLVLDYKSGQPEDEHVDQVRKYLTCLNQGNDEEQTPARGLLVYLDQRRFRLVTQDSASELVPHCHDLLPIKEDLS
ncbi:UvrD-helicase domain-containing protein [Desulfovibrio intestinalis]|uniref:DNA 3'-5' helicase n=1 Tax=Desulfovibrio intestinalis TaxID=58621 RepID=A0A7W8FHE0_9BACT|nr:UvrD-helicase domain-containing protein [Desulfovibrio intestinalis]MBB5143762.1 ATP-dependent exoDNAse (exonuclease V) beta subunit [Desulfovibrio intestinalis]